LERRTHSRRHDGAGKGGNVKELKDANKLIDSLRAWEADREDWVIGLRRTTRQWQDSSLSEMKKPAERVSFS
jgi:hypothetical protein